MYHYTDFDAAFLKERNAQFRAQVERRIDGSLTEDEFKPLRLMNGLYAARGHPLWHAQQPPNGPVGDDCR
jgi:sulfite reductase beta subunit-like hemoprotein